MPSLLELVEKVNRNEVVDAAALATYQDSPNAAERFMSNHARATLDLRDAQQHMLQSLEAIDFADQKVIHQFVSVSSFLGLSNLRTEPIVRFAAAATVRKEFGLALEAMQNALAADVSSGGSYLGTAAGLDRVTKQYEQTAAAIGFRSESTRAIREPGPLNIACVVSAISDDESTSSTLATIARHLDPSRFRFSVYSTEANVRRDKQQFGGSTFSASSIKRGPATLDTLGQRRTPVWFAATDGDLATAAKELATQLTKDQIDVVLFDTNAGDAIAATVASWDLGLKTIELGRRFPLGATTDSLCVLDSARAASEGAAWVVEGVEPDDSPAAPTRASCGIPEAALVLMSAATELPNSFADAVIQTLRANAQAIYLLVADGDVSGVKRRFESAGVSKRVGYASKRRDFAAFVKLADVYLASPEAASGDVLHAMNAEKPVLACAGSRAAEIVGGEGTVQITLLADRAGKLVADTAGRVSLGRSLRDRVREKFSAEGFVHQIERVIENSAKASGSPVALAA